MKLSATSADGHSLKQRWTFTWRSLATIMAVRLRTLAETSLIFLILSPGNVPGMRVRQQYAPLILRQTLTPSGPFLRAGTPVDIGASVTRIMEDRKRSAMDKIAPQQGALVDATEHTGRKQKVVFIEVFHHAAGRSCSSIGFEHKANRLLYLLIRVAAAIVFHGVSIILIALNIAGQ